MKFWLGIIFTIFISFCNTIPSTNASSSLEECFKNGDGKNRSKKRALASYLSTISLPSNEIAFYLTPDELLAQYETIGEGPVILNLSRNKMWLNDVPARQRLAKFQPRMVGLDLSDNILKAEDLVQLEAFPNIIWLSLENTDLTNDMITKLPPFPYLYLNISNNYVTSEALTSLKATNLAILVCGETSVDDFGVLYMLQNMASLKKVYLNSCNLGDKALFTLSRFLHLTYVNIKDNVTSEEAVLGFVEKCQERGCVVEH
ncbi:MAG: hypothetical protein K2Y18_04390 [Alphaproteobacteria bacterium]|jgi:hypothetical protein|nr:hypothetical protein [Alphaproteobacteria bacterium]